MILLTTKQQITPGQTSAECPSMTTFCPAYLCPEVGKKGYPDCSANSLSILRILIGLSGIINVLLFKKIFNYPLSISFLSFLKFITHLYNIALTIQLNRNTILITKKSFFKYIYINNYYIIYIK